MRMVVTAMAVLALLGILVMQDRSRGRFRANVSEGCLACHCEVADPDRFHPVAALGCSSCHLGNSRAFEKDRAHQGMAVNPADLRTADRTCGRENCHPGHVDRVKKSVMATNTGIIASLYRLWDSSGMKYTRAVSGGSGPVGVRVLMDRSWDRSPPEDYYAKLCASCHLWRPVGRGGGEFALRGGGCSACHVVSRPKVQDDSLSRFDHPVLSMRVPVANCVRCHNRSARIGLTYQGMLEDDGYGTPHQGGGSNSRALSGGRHYQNLPPDVHFKAGMACIDCHTGLELMGDGTAHGELSAQLEIKCVHCHQPDFAAGGEALIEADRLSELNDEVPAPGAGASLAATAKGSVLYALRLVSRPKADRPGKAVLYRKLDGQPLTFATDGTPRPHHALPGHERLSCQACHSPFMPQCYGCHVSMRQDQEQYDKLLDRPTPGKWRETRSYTRFESPALALAWDGRIMPASPCQVAVSVFDARGRYRRDLSPVAAMGRAFDPHSTQKASRTCADCHLSPKAMGLGQGRLEPGRGGGGPLLDPAYDAAASRFGHPAPPEAMNAGLDFAGARAGCLGPAEVTRIMSVGPCLPCHGDWDDPVWLDFGAARQRFHGGLAPGCELSPGAGRAGREPVQGDTLYRDRLLQFGPEPGGGKDPECE